MTAAPGPNSILVLADCPTRHPLVAAALRGRSDTRIDHHGGRTPHVPNVRYCGTKRSATLCPQEKTSAQGHPLHRPISCTRSRGHHHHGAHQPHENKEEVSPT